MIEEIDVNQDACFHPSRAIFIYEEEQPKYANQQKNTIALAHSVIGTDSNGDPIYGPAKIVTAKILSGLLNALTDRGAKMEFLPPQVLGVAKSAVCWFVPPQERTIWLYLDRESYNQNKEPTKLHSQHPGLVFWSDSRNVKVFAVKESTRPVESTQLYLPPYFNMYDSGGLCRGNTPFPKECRPDTIAAFESAFFHSVFTHPNHKMTSHPKGDYGFWREIAANPEQPFPYQYLLPAQMTVADIL